MQHLVKLGTGTMCSHVPVILPPRAPAGAMHLPGWACALKRPQKPQDELKVNISAPLALILNEIMLLTMSFPIYLMDGAG